MRLTLLILLLLYKRVCGRLFFPRPIRTVVIHLLLNLLITNGKFKTEWGRSSHHTGRSR